MFGVCHNAQDLLAERFPERHTGTLCLRYPGDRASSAARSPAVFDAAGARGSDAKDVPRSPYYVSGAAVSVVRTVTGSKVLRMLRVPRSGPPRPRIMSIVVVLPAPLGPSRAAISPSPREERDGYDGTSLTRATRIS